MDLSYLMLPFSSRARRLHFYQAHLDRVSRSFALGIRGLEPTLREPVALTYLICRILDTIEDAPWALFSSQKKAFETFEKFLGSEPTATEVRSWSREFPSAIAEGERKLLQDARRVFSDFHRLPKIDRSVIEPSVRSMMNGMKHFADRAHREGKLVLRSLGDVNRYCFFVAGVVGEILTGVLIARASQLKSEPIQSDVQHLLLCDGAKFGLFLQKVNVLKDHLKDETEGRFLLPDRENVYSSVRSNAQAAFRYLSSIPLGLRRYRMFCAWSLFLGLASLPWIQGREAKGELRNSSAGDKIPRSEAMKLLLKLEQNIDRPEALIKDFDEILSRAVPKTSEFSQPGLVADLIWEKNEALALTSRYSGALSEKELEDIFLSA